jgi:ribosomal protein S27AE
MWFVASFFIFLAGVIVSFMMIQDSSLERAVALTFLLIIIAPVALLFSLPAMYSATRAVPEIRAVLIEVTSERALAFITSRRALTLPELALLAGIPLGETDNIVDDLLRSGRLAGSLDPSTGWIYTSAYLADQQSQLLAWINLRGHITIEELAQLLRVSSVVTLDWIYQLVQRRQFAGYVNWKTRTLYAEAARKIGANSQCPECGGALVPASVQRIVCQSCGTEMFGRRIKLTSP